MGLRLAALRAAGAPLLLEKLNWTSWTTIDEHFGQNCATFCVKSFSCLIFLGCSLHVKYSVLQSSSQNAKFSNFIDWCSWPPLSPKCWVKTHHIVWERTLGQESPIFFASKVFPLLRLSASVLAAFGLFPSRIGQDLCQVHNDFQMFEQFHFLVQRFLYMLTF